jgi:hypothetical protein
MSKANHFSGGQRQWLHDKNLYLRGRAELLLCPEILGGAAAAGSDSQS